MFGYNQLISWDCIQYLVRWWPASPLMYCQSFARKINGVPRLTALRQGIARQLAWCLGISAPKLYFISNYEDVLNQKKSLKIIWIFCKWFGVTSHSKVPEYWTKTRQDSTVCVFLVLSVNFRFNASKCRKQPVVDG